MAIAGKDGGNGVAEFQFYQPENRTKWEAFQKAIYNKSTNQFLGRTPKNWGQLFVFYTIFYIVLAALFAICMQGLFASLDEREPRWKLGDSLIGQNPGLGFRPMSNKTEEGSLIWYNTTNTTTVNKWVGYIEHFLNPYKANQTGKNFVPCYFDKPPGPNEVCKTTISQFNNCDKDNMYGFNSLSPCIFLKLNRIIDWVPKYFTTPQKDMPEELASHISALQNTTSPERMVWVTCNGVDDIDKENVKEFKYYPKGFASYYYPYKNVKNYLSPVVAVQLINITPNVVISIECRAWAENIEYRGGSLNRAGSVRFEIQGDTEYRPPYISTPKNFALIGEPKTTAENKQTTAKVQISINPKVTSPPAHNLNTTANKLPS